MTKIEFLRRGKLATVTEMEKLAALAEEAGAKWDPEKPELPERVVAQHRTDSISAYESCILPKGGRWMDRNHRERGYNEAVRRWNAWNKLRRLVDCLGDDGPPHHMLSQEDRERRRMLLAILDGKDI